MNIKTIIFDWDGTLFDSDTKKEFPDSEETLLYCRQKGYKMTVASLVRPLTSDSLEQRKKQIETSSLHKYLDLFDITDDKEKDGMLDKIVRKMNLPRAEILIVDDRAYRSIKYGNKNGHPTVWLQKGRFADELPNSETGIPTFTIKSLAELKNII